jgi:foldase protein PrsA
VSKAIRFIPALGAVLFALVGLAACGSSGVPGNAVAKVEETPITTAAFKHWLGVAAYASTGGVPGAKPVLPDPPNYTACIAHFKEQAAKEKAAKPPSEAAIRSQCETQYKSYKQEVLSFLLSSQWVLGEAKALGVHATDQEVKKQFLKIKNQQFPKAAEFERFLASSGQTVSDLLLRVKLNLLSSKIQQKIAKEKHAVSAAQVEKYYNENKSRYGSPEKRNVAIILTKTEAEAKEAKKEIESGKSFAEVAKKRSQDPSSKNNGGLIVGVVKGQESPALDQGIFSAPVNKLSGPVKTPFGYYIYEVKAVTPGTQQSLNQVKATIKAQLAATQNQEALSKFVKEFKKRWQAKTSCDSEYVVADCHEYKAPKTGTSTGTTAPTG